MKAGREAAVHVLDSILHDENTDAVLLMDAENAFNSINKEEFIHNVRLHALLSIHLFQIVFPVHQVCLLS